MVTATVYSPFIRYRELKSSGSKDRHEYALFLLHLLADSGPGGFSQLSPDQLKVSVIWTNTTESTR
jgi:hypothetical protein